MIVIGLMEKKTPKPKIVVICGPTGSGKTAAALALASVFKGQIISADSMQVYRHMDIGTAKPTPAQQRRIAHHLIDILAPDEPFNASRYARLAAGLIFDLYARLVPPFVVGGTGLYIKALLHGLFKDEAADPDIRRRLRTEARDAGSGALYARLQALDPPAARRIHPHDTFRIIRALEVYEATGRPISDHHRRHRFEARIFQVLKLGLDMSREVLYERINRRVDEMIAAGLVTEVETLLKMGYDPALKSMQSLGYRHVAAFLQGRLAWEEALQTLKRDTRRYAKRQLTWFKNDPEIHWVRPDKLSEIQGLIENFLYALAGPPKIKPDHLPP